VFENVSISPVYFMVEDLKCFILSPFKSERPVEYDKEMFQRNHT
jgi:hypothetical protein